MAGSGDGGRLGSGLKHPVEVLQDDRFFASHARFAQWADGRKTWTMEHFYREMREEHDILMADGKPEGDRWNFDADNRKRLPAKTTPPNRARFTPDEMTRAVIEMVEDTVRPEFRRVGGVRLARHTHGSVGGA